MSAMRLHPILQKFMETMDFASTHFFGLIDLRVVAVAQMQIDIDSLPRIEREKLKQGFEFALIQMVQMGLIHKYELIDDGFKIYPQDKLYMNETALEVHFRKEENDIVA